MDTSKRGTRVPDQRELEEAIRELEEHLVHLRSLLEQARAAGATDEADETDWSVFDAEPRDPPDREPE